MVCIVPFFVAHAGAQPFAKGKGAANQPSAVELQRLQGTWQGFMVGHEKATITVTISSNSLHFPRDEGFWFKTTFTQPVGTDPKQLRTTIKDAAPGQESSVGQVVGAIYKIEDGTLTLVALGGDDEEKPKSFEASEVKGLSRYELRKVPPQKIPSANRE